LGVTDDSVSSIQIDTADGLSLEAELSAGQSSAVAVVITHPHPTYGGSMHTPVPEALFGQCRQTGVACLRFNFRGVGRSTGTHDNGIGEQHDVRAAVNLMSDRFGCPVVLAGWSFGADVALAVDDDSVAGWLAVAAPLAILDPANMAAATADKPKRLLVPEHDQFRTPASAAELTKGWPDCEIEPVPGADHFLAGGLHLVSSAPERFVGELT